MLRLRAEETLLVLDAATNDRTMMKIRHDDSDRSSRMGRMVAVDMGLNIQGASPQQLLGGMMRSSGVVHVISGSMLSSGMHLSEATVGQQRIVMTMTLPRRGRLFGVSNRVRVVSTSPLVCERLEGIWYR